MKVFYMKLLFCYVVVLATFVRPVPTGGQGGTGGTTSLADECGDAIRAVTGLLATMSSDGTLGNELNIVRLVPVADNIHHPRLRVLLQPDVPFRAVSRRFANVVPRPPTNTAARLLYLDFDRLEFIFAFTIPNPPQMS